MKFAKNLFERAKEAALNGFFELKSEVESGKSCLILKWPAIKLIQNVALQRLEQLQSLDFSYDKGLKVDLLTDKGVKANAIIKEVWIVKEEEEVLFKAKFERFPQVGHEGKILHVLLSSLAFVSPTLFGFGSKPLFEKYSIKMDKDYLIWKIPEREARMTQGFEEGELFKGFFKEEGLEMGYHASIKQQDLINEAIQNIKRLMIHK